MIRTVSEVGGNQLVDVHYSNGVIPDGLEENFENIFSDHGDVTLEEMLLAQESVYLSLQSNSRSNGNNASNHEQSQIIREVGESSLVRSVNTQLALDEALARSLQDMPDDYDDAPISGTIGATTAGNAQVNSTATSSTAGVVRSDNIDLDNMTYEELRSLGDSIGTESKGLSDDIIALLPTHKYKIGLFSKKGKHEECVICYMEYKNREKLTALPCTHQYHSKCVTRWLKLNKTCPICNTEVFGSGS